MAAMQARSTPYYVQQLHVNRIDHEAIAYRGPGNGLQVHRTA
jgi:hypothetical protein